MAEQFAPPCFQSHALTAADVMLPLLLAGVGPAAPVADATVPPPLPLPLPLPPPWFKEPDGEFPLMLPATPP